MKPNNGHDKQSPNTPHPQTRAVRPAHMPAEASGDVASAIHLSTTFEHGPAYEVLNGYTYARDNNPNVAAFEAALAELEGGACALAFGSGVAAGAALLQGLPRGARVIFHQDTYLDFKNLVAAYFPRWSLAADFVDLSDLDALEAALARPCALVWFETPSNPQLDIVDIAGVVTRAHGAGARVLVDGTFASPALQRPLDLGADYCLQSVTKFIGGHSDCMGGALVLRDGDDEPDMRKMRKLTGGVMAPFSAWLAARGLQTLFCRVEKQSQTAMMIAGFLEQHRAVERVHYPGLVSNRGHEIAKKQMRAFGALVSFEVKGGAEAAIRAASRVQLFTTATSVGGVESLIEHRPSVEQGVTNTPQGLLRASIGLEHQDDLIGDLDAALSI